MHNKHIWITISLLTLFLIIVSACTPGTQASETQAPQTQAPQTQAPQTQTSVPEPQKEVREPTDLIVGSPVLYGEVWEKTITEIMKEQFNVNVYYQDLLVSEMLTKAIAEKDNPEISVYCPSSDGFITGRNIDLWEKIDRSIVTNYDNLYPYAKSEPWGEYGVGVSSTPVVLEYNKVVFEENGWNPPTSWFEDMMDPKYKGRIGLTSTTSGTGVGLLMFWSDVLDQIVRGVMWMLRLSS